MQHSNVSLGIHEMYGPASPDISLLAAPLVVYRLEPADSTESFGYDTIREAKTVDLAITQEKFGVVRHCSGTSYFNISSLAYSNSGKYAKMHGYEHFGANVTTMPS